jgi:hypothetical protein
VKSSPSFHLHPKGLAKILSGEALFELRNRLGEDGAMAKLAKLSSGDRLPLWLALPCTKLFPGSFLKKTGLFLRLFLSGASEADASHVRQTTHDMAVIGKIESPKILTTLSERIDVLADDVPLEEIFNSIEAYYGTSVGAESRRQIVQFLDTFLIPYGRKREGAAWTVGDLRHKSKDLAIFSDGLGCSSREAGEEFPLLTLSKAEIVALATIVGQIPGALATVSVWPKENGRYDVRLNFFWGIGAMMAADRLPFSDLLLRPIPSLIINCLCHNFGAKEDSIFQSERESLEATWPLILSGQYGDLAAKDSAARGAIAAMEEDVPLFVGEESSAASTIPPEIIFFRPPPNG